MPTPRRLYEVVRFLVAGGLGVCLYYLLLYTLTEYFKCWYMLSAAIASVVNFTSNFLLQKFWTFKNTDRQNIRHQVLKYAFLVVTLFLSNLGLLHVLVKYAHLWYIAAQIPVTIVLTVASYLISKKIFSA